MKKKVVQFIRRIEDAGAETLIKDYALLLDKEKFDVVILCYFANKNSIIYKTLKENNIEVIEMYKFSSIIGRAISRIFGIKYNSLLFEKNINKIKPDILHIHLEILDIVYHAHDCLGNIKLFYTCHNLPKTLIGEDLPNEEKACKYLIKNNNLQIIALHKDMADEINRRFNIDNTVVIKNAINFGKFLNIKEKKEEIRKKLNIKKDSLVIGSIGRLEYQKNPEFVIKVFNELLKKNNNSHLLMIGHGRQKNKIINLIKEYKIEDKVTLLSHREDIPLLLKTMDRFIFPSRYEGLGIVLIEAQVVGIPCIVSDTVPSEAFQSNLITKLSLSDSLDKWVESLINPKCNINKYGNINDYDMKKEIKKLENLYI